MVNCFHNVVESLQMFIRNVSYLNCTMVGKGMQKLKERVCQGARKNQAAILGLL